MKLSYGLTIEQTQKLAITPELIQAIRILQYNAQELDNFVQDELMSNPVLELERSHLDDSTEEFPKDEPEIDLREKLREDYDDISYDQREYRSKNETVSFEQFVSKDETLEDYLLLQLTFSRLKDKELKIGRYLIEGLDENGYLTVPLEHAAKIFDTTEEKIEKVLKVIQGFDPVGVGARDLKECLLIQLADKELLDDNLEYIIKNHLEDLADNKLSKVAKKTGLTVTQVQMFYDVIRTLEPKPGRSFASSQEIKYVIPDVLVDKVDGEYVVSTNERSVPHIMVSPYYTTLSKESKNDEELSKYLTDKFNSAVWLIRSIEQRKQTIYRVVSAVVAHQKEFLDKGPKYLKTLTLKEIAADLGVHESTVSRSINGKYMQTPRGVFEIKYFFSSGVASQGGDSLSSNSIKSFIKEIVAGEDPKRPYSDQEMVSLLSEKGIEISRRTVAKYREGMNILSSAKRRRYE